MHPSIPPRPACHPPIAAPATQTGAGLAEFSVMAVPLLLAGLGAVELAAWLHTRQALSLALLEAARAGVADHARPDGMAAAFEQALLPLFAGGRAPARRAPAQSLQAALDER